MAPEIIIIVGAVIVVVALAFDLTERRAVRRRQQRLDAWEREHMGDTE
jgi:hypothetical protein